MIDKDELLKRVTPEIVIEIMDENGAPLNHTSRDGSTGQQLLWFKTICHGGSKPKLCYFTQSKNFFCYTSCGAMSFFEGIKRIRNVRDKDFYKGVILYIADKVGLKSTQEKGFGTYRKDDRDDMRTLEDNMSISGWGDWCEKIKNQNENINNKIIQDETILNYFENKIYDGWFKEGISEKSMKKYGIKWYEYQKHIIIPHRNEDGQLIGIRRRSLKPEDKNNKYMPEFIEGKDYGHSLGLNLYGLYENKAAIEERGKAIIVEGEKSVLLSDTYFGKNSIAVATCGFSVSNKQANLLGDLGVRQVYLGFDKDFDEFDSKAVKEYNSNPATKRDFEMYKNKIISIASKLAGMGFAVYIIKDKEGKLKIKDSPFDEGKETFQKLFASAEKFDMNKLKWNQG